MPPRATAASAGEPQTSRAVPAPPTGMSACTHKRLQAICTGVDPAHLYRNLAKIGRGTSRGMYAACQVGASLSVAIKQMGLGMLTT